MKGALCVMWRLSILAYLITPCCALSTVRSEIEGHSASAVSVSVSSSGEPTRIHNHETHREDRIEAEIDAAGQTDLAAPQESSSFGQMSSEVHLHDASEVNRQWSRTGSSLVRAEDSNKAMDSQQQPHEDIITENPAVALPRESESPSMDHAVEGVSFAALRHKLSSMDVSTATLLVACIMSCVFGVAIAVVALAGRSEKYKKELEDTFDELTMGPAASLLGGDALGQASEEPTDVDQADAVEQKYDFVITDEKADWQTRYWKWCTKEEAEVLGVQVQAPSIAYKDQFHRIDIDSKIDSVKNLMTSASIDFNHFDEEQDMEKLLWKLLRAECYFMATMDKRSVLLMVETVRLRIIDGGKILMQECDQSFLHSRPGGCLPGLEKGGSQSPVAASEDLWNKVLKMPLDIVDFIEDSVEDTEFNGFAGLRCVERAHTMHVKLRTSDPDAIRPLGLPAHERFTCNDLQEEGQPCQRTFEWITMEQYVKMGGAREISRADVRGKSLVEGQDNNTNLVSFLRNGGVDPDEWGEAGGSVRKLQLLTKELKAGKCYLEENSSGITRVVNIVSVRIWSPNREYLLVDWGRRNDHGDENMEPQLPGRKKEKTETLQEVAAAMCQIVRLNEDNFSFPDEVAWEYFDYSETSSRFKGLVTKYQKFFVDAVLEEDEELLRRMGLHQI